MSLSPEFLEELRSRVPVSDVVGKRVKLIKKGREHSGLCPFHNEKTPSFSVVDDKNFYHCFGCGAHGDVITFVMETEGRSFPEAVEELAAMAGLEVPKPTREERERSELAKTLQDAVEAACNWFQQQLTQPVGREASRYLGSRGLNDKTIATFRLGYAPAERGALRKALNEMGYPNEMLAEAGLIKKSDRDNEFFDYFRDRVMFPITDRTGRVIAFGGRILGDGQPKYLNSPDNPLFHKGRVLYGLAQARETARKSSEILVAEGYMDVIALAQAGFNNAVAPLGTALTEEQIVQLWRLAPEPILCLDGDEAGQRAAGRAAERALPLLKPGHSLRFTTLPAGQDPDDLIKRHGAQAMRDLIASAVPLSDYLWSKEQNASPTDTPERKADFLKRVRDHIHQIQDETVKQAYFDTIDQKRRDDRQQARGGNFSYNRPPSFTGGRRNFTPPKPVPNASHAARRLVQTVLPRRQQEILVATILNHPGLIDEVGDSIGQLQLDDPMLDKLRQEILDVAGMQPDLDSDGLVGHLNSVGFSDKVRSLLRADALAHAAFAKQTAGLDKAREGLRELLSRSGRSNLEAQLAEAERAIEEDFTEANWARVTALREALETIVSGPRLEDTP